LADRGIRVELAGGAVGTLAEVQRDLVSVLGRLEDEQRVGLGFVRPPREVDEGGVCAERVVGVVAALLERSGRYDQALSGEGSRDLRATGRGVRRLGARGGHGLRAFGPS